MEREFAFLRSVCKDMDPKLFALYKLCMKPEGDPPINGGELIEDSSDEDEASEYFEQVAGTRKRKRVQVVVKSSKKRKDQGTTTMSRYVHQFKCVHCCSTYHVKATWPVFPDETKCAICGKWFNVKGTPCEMMTMAKFKKDLPFTMLF